MKKRVIFAQEALKKKGLNGGDIRGIKEDQGWEALVFAQLGNCR